MKPAPSPLVRVAVALALGSSAAAFAQAPATPPAAPGATPPAAGAPTPPAPGTPRPFKDVLKDAKETKGFFNLWQKDDKVWIELKPDQLEKPFFVSIVNTHSLGEGRFWGGLMGPSTIAFFRKSGSQVQLIAQNERFRAAKGSPVERAVEASFSDSLIASAAVASAPHPDTKAVLVEANGMMVADFTGLATQLETSFRIAYALDARNSSLVKAETNELATSFHTTLHFAVPKLPAPPLVPNPAQPRVPPPRSVPDPRSLFFGYRVNLAQLPAVPMKPRVADERVGYFTTGFRDFTDDLKAHPGVYYVNRWRLQKKDASAELSEPVKPIVYWVDRNIPVKHRQAVIDGILEWNKAFERIGFKDAIQARVQPDNADFDTSDVRYATVRWYLTTETSGGSAVGPSHVDPRTGEILDADIIVADVFTRGPRRMAVDDLPRPRATPTAFGQAHAFCDYAEQAHQEADFALDILEARGDIEPGSPEADEIVFAYLKETVAHEVGHTLGLRHNFRSSTIYTAAQLRDPEFTKKNGIVGSVMDYAPFNLPLKGEPKADYVHPGLGPYDYWAIEYGYKPLDPATEKAELEKIAARGSTEPWLAYATDEDGWIGGSPHGMDPTVNIFDLSDNPIAYYRKRLDLSRELWDRLQAKQLEPGETYDRLRQSFLAGFQTLSRGMVPATKFIGGVVQLRDRAGTNRLPFTPVSAAQQREALKVLNDGMFTVDSFRFKPEFLASLPHSRLEAYDNLLRGHSSQPPQIISLPTMVFDLQKTVLDQVLSDAVAKRIVESQQISKDGANAFRLSELYDTLQASIWAELKSGKEVTPMRRNLQREHLRRVAGALLRPSAAQPADARSLLRFNALALAAEIKASQAKPAFSKETRAHLSESLNTLEEALKAPMQRTGV
jgi:hypothetical protein